jgi:hypothetical protein
MASLYQPRRFHKIMDSLFPQQAGHKQENWWRIYKRRRTKLL